MEKSYSENLNNCNNGNTMILILNTKVSLKVFIPINVTKRLLKKVLMAPKMRGFGMIFFNFTICGFSDLHYLNLYP